VACRSAGLPWSRIGARGVRTVVAGVEDRRTHRPLGSGHGQRVCGDIRAGVSGICGIAGCCLRHRSTSAHAGPSIRLGRGAAGERWFSPVLVPAIPPNGTVRLDWLGDDVAALGATYTDADRYFFTTKCGEDVSMFLIGLHLPRWPLLKAGQEKAVPQWWRTRGLPAGRWSEVKEGESLRRWWLPGRYGLSRRMGGWADPVSLYRGGPGPGPS
jgi:hypothetical protein